MTVAIWNGVENRDCRWPTVTCSADWVKHSHIMFAVVVCPITWKWWTFVIELTTADLMLTFNVRTYVYLNVALTVVHRLYSMCCFVVRTGWWRVPTSLLEFGISQWSGWLHLAGLSSNRTSGQIDCSTKRRVTKWHTSESRLMFVTLFWCANCWQHFILFTVLHYKVWRQCR